MSSWAEYKKKREEEKKTAWQQYKERRQQELQDSNKEERIATKMEEIWNDNNEDKINPILRPGAIATKTLPQTEKEEKSILDIQKKDKKIQNSGLTADNLSGLDKTTQNILLRKMNSISSTAARQLQRDITSKETEEYTQKRAEQINNDMSNGNYMSAIGHILLGVPQKAIDTTKTTFASLGSITNDIQLPKFGGSNIKINGDDVLKLNKIETKQYEDISSKIDNDVVKTASGISGTIGQMIPSMIANTVAPGSGVYMQGLNVGTEAYQDTLKDDLSNKTQATITGIAKGITSALVEKISGGNIIGKGSLDDTAAKVIEKNFKGKIGQKLASKAYEMIGEIGEENLENQLGYVIDKLVNNKEMPDAAAWWNEASETTKSTFLTTLVLNVLGLGGSTYNDVQDIKTEKFLNEAKNIIRTDLNNNSNLDINERINKLNEVNNINNISDYNNYKSNEQKRNLIQQINQDTNLDIDNKVELLNKLNKIENSEQFSKFLKENSDSLKKLSSYQDLEQSNLQRQQSILQNDKTAQNQFSEQINNNIANNQETLYNNNESESDIYEYGEEQRRESREIERLFRDIRRATSEQGNDTNVLENEKGRKGEAKQRIIEYAERYPAKNLTQEESDLINKIKEATGIDTVLYNLGGETLYGGLSKQGKLYVDRNIEVNTRNLILHELVHGLRQTNNPIYANELYPVIVEITNNKDYANSLFKYITEKSEKFTIDDLEDAETRQIIAEEIIGNTSASLYGDLIADYDLSDEMVTKIKNAIGKIVNTDTENSNKSSFNLQTETDIQEINKNVKVTNKGTELPKTKKELLDNNSKAINQYIQEKNNTTRNIESQINEYNKKLNSMQDKDSVEANKIKAKLIELSKKQSDIEALYNKRIEKAIEKGQKILAKPDMSGRKAVIQKNRELARERIENIRNWKDKSNGIKYQRETMERNMFDIIPNKQEAQKMIDTYFEPIHESEANKQRFINTYNNKIKELNLNKYESEAVQLLGEQKYNPDFKSDDVKPVLDRVNENIEKGKIDRTKVDQAIETFRNIYDELFELENQALKENGYPEKPYRKGYFPHFIDAEPVNNFEKVLEKFGFKVDKRPLPTDIAGLTEQFVPGKTWNRSALRRKTDSTSYNALKGFDTYISQAADNIYHTENIQKLRALENEIRYQYSDEGVQARIDEIYNNDALTQDEQQAAIEKVFEQIDNPMPNLVVELRRYTNALANKKSEADRSAEQKYGRQIYSTVNAIENRFGANAVGLNIGSAITNFIPITQAYSQVSTKNMGRAVIDTIKSYINDDGFTDSSNFLTNRLNQSEKLYKTSLEKISDKTSFLFNAIDNVASNIVVRGKYLQNLDEGMNVQEAIKNADRFGANLMADRSKGAMPTLFNEKSPLTKAFTQFQLEVNNQYSYMFKDMPRDLRDKGIANLALAFFKMFIAAFFYNKASEEIVGRKPAFSPIDIAVDSYKTLSDENTSTADKMLNVGKDIAEELPFVGGFLGGGRIPVSSALPDGENTFKAVTGLVTGEMDSNKALNTLGKELSKPAYYLLPPFGGGQLKKTVEGVSSVANGGSYGVDSKGNETLQFPVENANAGDYIKAGLFGKYGLDNAKEYADRGYKSLNAKQTQIYKEANIPYKELLDYIDQKLTKKEDKISYIEGQNLNENQKWGIYKYDILSNTERKDGGSQLSDAEYMINNGMTKKEYIDMYNKAQKNNIDIPTADEYKNLQKKGININSYIDYKSEIKSQTNKKRERGELKENQSLKDADKISILLNSNYSNKEIKAIYEEDIKASNDTKYDIISKSGINIKEYLKYKQQEFESDKEDDGTTSGKTISNSKKEKVYNYVNNMNITYNQKLLLLGMQYNLTNAEKSKLANYVNSLNISKQEKMSIYEKLKGFTTYSNGTIKW